MMRTANSRSNSVPRKSGEMIPGITEEDEEEDEEMEDLEVEEVDQFDAELPRTSDVDVDVGDDAGTTFTEPVSPLTPLPPAEHNSRISDVGAVPLTAEALAMKEEEEEELEQRSKKSSGSS
jgi:hypothetical protein